MKEDLEKCPGHSVGALIKKEGKILLLFRKKFPIGWAPPAGHIEEGETPDAALIREIQEEVGLRIISSKLLIGQKEFPNSCSRGYKKHDWWVFEIEIWKGLPGIKEPDKAEELGWFSPEAIRELAKKDQMDPAWRYIFQELQIL